MAAFGTGLFQWGDKRFHSCQRLHLLRLDWDLEPVTNARLSMDRLSTSDGVQAVLACTHSQYGCSIALTCIACASVRAAYQRCKPQLQYTGTNRFVTLTVAAEM